MMEKVPSSDKIEDKMSKACKASNLELLNTILTQSKIDPKITLLKTLRKSLNDNLDVWIKNDSQEVIEFVVRNGGYPVDKEINNYSVFSYFVKKNHIEIVNLLIEKTEDLDFLDLKTEPSMLQIAVEENKLQVAEMLLSKGARVNLIKFHDQNCFICDCSCISKAIKAGHSEMLQLLLNFGASTRFLHNKKNNISPLGLACMKGNLEAMRILVKHGVNVNAYCFRMSNEDIFDLMPPLLVATEWYEDFKNIECIKFLMENNADLDKQNPKSQRAPVFGAVQYPEILELFLQKGVDINIQDDDGWTPMHRAIYERQIDSIKILLNHQPDFRLTDDEGKTVYHFAISELKQDDILRLFLRYRYVNVNNLRDKGGRNLLHELSATFPHNRNNDHKACKIANTLFHYGGDMSIRNYYWDEDFELPICQVSGAESFCSKINYFDKVFLLNYQISEDNLALLKKFHYKQDDQTALKLYGPELEELKTFVVVTYPKMSLYDILLANRNISAKLSTNVNVQKILEKFGQNLEDRFPHFGLLLSLKIEKSLARKMSLDTAVDKFACILGCRLPETSSEKIFLYFNKYQLDRFNANEKPRRKYY